MVAGGGGGIPLHNVAECDQRNENDQKEHQKFVDEFLAGTDFAANDLTINCQFGILSGVNGAADGPFGILDA